ncbi:hypothetical protein Tco_1177129, partial [Tanacetum coccineum]
MMAGGWRLWCFDEVGMEVGGGVVRVMMVMIMRVVLWWAAVGRQPEEVEASGYGDRVDQVMR